MTHSIHVSPLAVEDLTALHRWLSEEADRPTADAYLDRIEARIASLAEYPDRGTLRDNWAEGVRTLTFERRLVIAYRVEDERVTVLRVIDARRDLGRTFAE